MNDLFIWDVKKFGGIGSFAFQGCQMEKNAWKTWNKPPHSFMPEETMAWNSFTSRMTSPLATIFQPIPNRIHGSSWGQPLWLRPGPKHCQVPGTGTTGDVSQRLNRFLMIFGDFRWIPWIYFLFTFKYPTKSPNLGNISTTQRLRTTSPRITGPGGQDSGTSPSMPWLGPKVRSKIFKGPGARGPSGEKVALGDHFWQMLGKKVVKWGFDDKCLCQRVLLKLPIQVGRTVCS